MASSCTRSPVHIQMGSSKGLKVGQAVFALGNSQGLSRTLTAGVVSGLNRAVPSPVNTLTYGAIQVPLLLHTTQTPSTACSAACSMCLQVDKHSPEVKLSPITH